MPPIVSARRCAAETITGFQIMTAETVRKKLEGAVESKMKRAMLASWGQLIQGTPVDTGRARASWRMTFGEIDPSAHPPVDKTVYGKGKKQIPVPKTPDISGGKGIGYISNNVPYINVLNDGSSEQAPRRFVQAAVARGIQIADAQGAVAADVTATFATGETFSEPV